MHYILAALFANPKFIFSRTPLLNIHSYFNQNQLEKLEAAKAA